MGLVEGIERMHSPAVLTLKIASQQAENTTEHDLIKDILVTYRHVGTKVMVPAPQCEQPKMI